MTILSLDFGQSSVLALFPFENIEDRAVAKFEDVRVRANCNFIWRTYVSNIREMLRVRLIRLERKELLHVDQTVLSIFQKTAFLFIMAKDKGRRTSHRIPFF